MACGELYADCDGDGADPAGLRAKLAVDLPGLRKTRKPGRHAATRAARRGRRFRTSI